MAPVDPARDALLSAPVQRSARKRLGEVLVAQGLLTTDELAGALDAQAELGPGDARRRLGRVLIDLGLVDERRLATALAEALGYEVADLRRTAVDDAVARLLPRQVAERYGVLPLGRTATGALRVAATDPTNVVAFDDVRLYTATTDLVVVVAVESQLREQVARVWSLAESSSDVAKMLEEDDASAPEDSELSGAGDAPVVRLVNDILLEAVRLDASDIHVEPRAGELRIRYRVDGLLRDVMSVPRRVASAVVSRIKVTSGLDIAERRRPQDGRAKLAVDGGTVDARVSTLPTVHGEKVVIRLVVGADDVPRLTDLGLADDQRHLLVDALANPQGLVLITGPTGSGKTSTLYSALQHVRSAERNVVTLEDPVEVDLADVNQVQVHERSGLTFALGLRAVLRQDPDVILVGEVRDDETAELALRASLTGHLVLTTLHTNDAVSSLTRLVDMGAQPFLVASSLTLVLAQRLVRVPCPDCAEPYAPDERTLLLLGLAEADLADASPVAGRGCAECGGTGYRGRTALFEVLPVTAAVRRTILTSPTEEALRQAARGAGVRPLRAAGLRLAARGGTTYEEVLRVTQVDAGSTVRCRTCDRELAEDMVACPWCAEAVGPAACAGCGRRLDAGWAICPWCRAPAAECGSAALTRT